MTAVGKNLEKVVGTKHQTPNEKIDPESVVILGGWSPSYLNIINKIPNKKGVLFCSFVGEAEMAPNLVELGYLLDIIELLKKGRIDFIIFSDEKLYKALELADTYYMPCPLEIKKFEVKNRTNGLSLFCPPKLTKNIFGNLLGARLTKKQLYTNLKSYEKIIKSLKIKAKVTDWLPRDEYENLISKMECNLAVSILGEYWNYQVMEAGLMGVPSVVNSKADYYPLNDLKVENPGDPCEIKEKIEVAVQCDRLEVQKKITEKVTEENKKVVDFLRETFI